MEVDRDALCWKQADLCICMWRGTQCLRCIINDFTLTLLHPSQLNLEKLSSDKEKRILI